MDHRIPVDPTAKLPDPRLYRLSFAESEELKKQLQHLLAKGWIKFDSCQPHEGKDVKDPTNDIC